MPERTFTESELLQIVGFMSAELEELHRVTAPRIMEAAQKAMSVVQPGGANWAAQLERGIAMHAVVYPSAQPPMTDEELAFAQARYVDPRAAAEGDV